ncbi:MAG: flagellar basal body rod protein FlgF [Acidithiobacillus sp.]
MEGSQYIGMTGMMAAARSLDVTANNLANSSSTAFKAERAAYRAVPFFYQGLPNRVDTVAQKNGINWQEGSIQQTGRPLDVAINGPGFFVVQNAGGTQAYSRAGNLDVTSQGMLVNANGQAILSTGRAPIYVPPNAQVSIAQDGTVSVIPNTPNAQAAVAGHILVVNPSPQSVRLAGNGTFAPANGATINFKSGVAANLVPGALEGSNVNPVDSMVHMISDSRLFQWETQAEQTIAADQKAAGSIPTNL